MIFFNIYTIKYIFFQKFLSRNSKDEIFGSDLSKPSGKWSDDSTTRMGQKGYFDTFELPLSLQNRKVPLSKDVSILELPERFPEQSII